ncbi:MAG: hypothetical protein M3R30_05205 [Candidatus Eremiobacteraeota bacterium]|nr:hypothetical protein [Candidatus Eremiobacteraeota bacterium]
MGHLGKVVAAFALIATVAASALAPDPVMVEIGINAAYDAQCAALVAGDADAWAKTLAIGFIPTMPNGKTGDAKTAHDGVAVLLSSAKIEKCRILPESIHLDGTDAGAVVAVTMSGTQTGGKSIAIEQHAVDRWTPSSDAWLQKSSTVSEQTVYIDGRVPQHSTAKGQS